MLISTLAFAIVASLLLAGMGVYAVSHFARARTEADYASALNLADSGIDYELRNISTNMVSNPNAVDQAYPAAGQNGPYTGSVSGVPGTFTVAVYAVDSSGSPIANQSWTPPNRALIRSTGTVNGVSRTVQIQAKRKSIFSEYAIFGIYNNNYSGNLYVVGDYGTDVLLVPSGGGNTSTHVFGKVVFDGVNGQIGPPYARDGSVVEPLPVQWPSIGTLALYYAGLAGAPAGTTDGFAWFRANNDNGRVLMFSATDASNTTDPTTQSWVSAGFQQTGGYWVVNSQGSGVFQNVTTDMNPMDNPGNTPTRYVYPTTNYNSWNYDSSGNPVTVTVRTISTWGLYKSKVLIFPGSPDPLHPYNYYFDQIDLSNTSSNVLLIDNGSPGQPHYVNFWLGPSTLSSATDNLNGQVYFTLSNPNDTSTSTGFRLYDGKSLQLNLHGNNLFCGSLYISNAGRTGTVDFNGSPTIFGSIIADVFNLGGTPLVYFPNTSDNASDYGLWFGFDNSWQEVNGVAPWP